MAEAKTEESSAILPGLLSRSFFLASSLSSHPLFAVLAAASLLVALYVPRSLLPFLLSPVPISTLLLLVALLRLGSSPAETPTATTVAAEEGKELPVSYLTNNTECFSNYHRKAPFCNDSGRRGVPLEVIYEEHEEEGELGCVRFCEYLRWRQNGDSGSGGLGSLRFADVDSDSGSDGGSPIDAAEKSSSPEELWLRWDAQSEEEDGEDMIEIDLKAEAEENLIEIDISGWR
ncbi:uncharacterized protein LOC141822800 [Curcuma longa]|uniref:uncharacterized protein LOC141822800 n=1 Tax=Curcuma longa TaxID=136217 RepID=UPI003D9F5268